jgi:hypothetical protein
MIRSKHLAVYEGINIISNKMMSIYKDKSLLSRKFV